MSLADGSYFIFNNERFAGRMLAEPRIIGPLPVVLLDQSVTPVKVGIDLISLSRTGCSSHQFVV